MVEETIEKPPMESNGPEWSADANERTLWTNQIVYPNWGYHPNWIYVIGAMVALTLIGVILVVAMLVVDYKRTKALQKKVNKMKTDLESCLALNRVCNGPPFFKSPTGAIRNNLTKGSPRNRETVQFKEAEDFSRGVAKAVVETPQASKSGASPVFHVDVETMRSVEVETKQKSFRDFSVPPKKKPLCKVFQLNGSEMTNQNDTLGQQKFTTPTKSPQADLDERNQTHPKTLFTSPPQADAAKPLPVGCFTNKDKFVGNVSLKVNRSPMRNFSYGHGGDAKPLVVVKEEHKMDSVKKDKSDLLSLGDVDSLVIDFSPGVSSSPKTAAKKLGLSNGVEKTLNGTIGLDKNNSTKPSTDLGISSSSSAVPISSFAGNANDSLTIMLGAQFDKTFDRLRDKLRF